MEELTSNVSDYVKEAINESTSELRKKVDDIVAVYSSQGTNINLPTLNVPKITISGISIESSLDTLAQVIVDKSSSWSTGGALGGAAAGAAIGSFIPVVGTFFGGLIGGAIGGLKSKPTLSEEKDRDRDSEYRQIIYNYINEIWDDVIKPDVANTILEEIRNSQIQEIVKEVASNYLTSYKDSLKSARILID
ncbi:MAG: hypothetical protein IKH26_05840 [Bacteroidaceae bacterium]|nr:hypothetical protein [Bacteroidaceae bacterium]